MTQAASDFIKNVPFKAFCQSMYNLMSSPDYQDSQLIPVIKQAGKDAAIKGKDLYMSLRIAVSGQTEGFELEPMLQIMGKDRIIEKLLHSIAQA